MKALITGSDGFIGRHLASALRARGDTVYGLSREPVGERNGVYVYQADITDQSAVQAALRSSQPEYIFHLAAQSNIPYSFAHPTETITTNLVGSVNVFAAAEQCCPTATIISVGSSAEYGTTSHPTPLTEDAPLSPSSPYAISKAAQGTFAHLYSEAYAMRSIHVRPFSIIGPGKQGDAVSDFCRGIRAIEQGQAQELKTGALTTQRDFIDVRDAVQALLLIAQHGQAGATYNICSGQATSLQEIITILLSFARRPVTVTPDPTKQRPTDDPYLLGDPTKTAALGFIPRYTLTQTLHDTLESLATMNQ